MKLYRLSQSTNNGWYTYDSAIVAAENEEKARYILPSPFYFWDNGFYYQYKHQEPALEMIDPSWCIPEDVKVEYIGTTRQKAGVILASFNAGFDESRYLDLRRLGNQLSTGAFTEQHVPRVLETMQFIEDSLHDPRLAELRYHLIEANRAHDGERVQEYELKVRDYMDEIHEDWR